MPKQQKSKKECKQCGVKSWRIGKLWYALTTSSQEYIATIQESAKIYKEMTPDLEAQLPARMVAFFKEHQKKCNCIICQESMEEAKNTEIYLLSCCANLLHNECAKKLPKNSKDKQNCPFCKKEISIYIKDE